MVGTDFNKGIKGVGPKTALKLVKLHKNLEGLPDEYRKQLPEETDKIRETFLNPTVSTQYEIRFTGLKEQELRTFLCDERGFSGDRVELAISRMRQFYGRERSTLTSWLGER